MTTAANTRRNDIVATAGQTVFSYTFEVADEGDLVVEQNGTALTLTTHYTVSGVGGENGGSVTLVTGATLDDDIAIYSDEAVERLADYTVAGDFRATTINAELDKVFRILGDLELAIARSVRLDDGDPTGGSFFTMGTVAARASKYLAMTSDGKLTFTSGTENAFIVSAFAETLLDDVDGDAFLATLTADIGLASMQDQLNITGWEHVRTQAASASPTLDFTNLDQAADHRFTCRHMLPATDGQSLVVRTSPDAGGSPTFDEGIADYQYHWVTRKEQETAHTISTTFAVSASSVRMQAYGQGNVAANEHGVNVELLLPDPGAGVYQDFHAKAYGVDDDAMKWFSEVSGQRQAAAVVQAVRFYFLLGNITSGTIIHEKRRHQTAT